MKTAKVQTLPAPPSLISALMVGFEAISNHIGLVLFPVVLDLFLWWGPHLSLRPLVSALLAQTASLSEAEAPGTAEMIRLTQEFWLIWAERFNLFTALRAYPVGIPSLMASRLPIETPLAAPVTWEIPSVLVAFGLWSLFTLAGLVVGALYFDVVLQAVIGKIDWLQALGRWPWASVQVLSLAVFLVVLLLAISVPASCLLTLTLLGGLSIGRFGIILYVLMLGWLLFPLIYSPHGIFLNRRKMWVSVREGFRLARMTFPSAALFVLLIILLSQGLDLLWRVPRETSWLALIGIAGHGFIATGLLAATFVYYRDAYRWMQRVDQQIKFMSA